MNVFEKSFFTDGDQFGNVTLRRQKFIIIDGEETPVGDPWCMAIGPKDINLVKEFTPELENVMKLVWETCQQDPNNINGDQINEE